MVDPVYTSFHSVERTEKIKKFFYLSLSGMAQLALCSYHNMTSISGFDRGVTLSALVSLAAVSGSFSE